MKYAQRSSAASSSSAWRTATSCTSASRRRRAPKASRAPPSSCSAAPPAAAASSSAPRTARPQPVVPLERVLHDVHEMAGAGTIFPDEAGRPVLHLHAAFGRDDQT